MTYDYDYWYDGGLNIDFASVYSIGGSRIKGDTIENITWDCSGRCL